MHDNKQFAKRFNVNLKSFIQQLSIKSIDTKNKLELFPVIFDNSNIHENDRNTDKDMTSRFNITVIYITMSFHL